jgi:hypothetical protein
MATVVMGGRLVGMDRSVSRLHDSLEKVVQKSLWATTVGSESPSGLALARLRLAPDARGTFPSWAGLSRPAKVLAKSRLFSPSGFATSSLRALLTTVTYQLPGFRRRLWIFTLWKTASRIRALRFRMAANKQGKMVGLPHCKLYQAYLWLTGTADISLAKPGM